MLQRDSIKTLMKKITIITVTLNSELTLKKTLDSVSSQSYSAIEHIIVDGGSSDNTRSIVKSHPNKLIKYYELLGSTIYEAMNYGIQVANNEFIAFLNSDDYYLDKNSISEVMKYFNQNKQLDAVFSDVEYFNGRDELRTVRKYKCNNFMPKKLHDGIMPPHPGIIIKADYYRKLKGFSGSYKIAADFNFLLQLFSQYKINYINTGNVLVRMRTGGISTRGLRSKILITKEIYSALRANGLKPNIRFIYIRLFNKLNQLLL